MQLLLRFLVCLVCFFGGAVASDMDHLALVANSGREQAFLFRHADEPGGIIRSHSEVLIIQPPCSVSQIHEAVVARISVPVVYDIRPLSGHVKPCEAVREVSPAVDIYGPVSVVDDGSGFIPSNRSVAQAHKPCEYACVRIVMQNGFEPFSRQFGHGNSLWMAGHGRGLQPASNPHIIEVSPWRA